MEESGKLGKKIRGRIGGSICVLTGGALYGLVGIFNRMLESSGFTAMEVVSLRLFGAAIVFGFIALFTDRSIFRIRLRDLWMFMGTGILSFVCFNWCYFQCMRLSSLSVAAVLLYISPTFVMILSVLLFHEKLTRWKGLSLGLTLAGVFLLCGGLGSGEAISGRALLCGLGSAFGYSLYSVFSRFALKKDYTPEQITFWTNVCGGVSTLIIVGQPEYFERLANVNAVLPILALIIACTILPMNLYNRGMMHLENSRAGILAMSEPVAAVVVSRLLYHEVLTTVQYVGIVLVLAAAAVVVAKSADPAEIREEESGEETG
ncbi:MAG: DMT family transporter [Lachnospiraceae bacterium]|jgi:DME family drug/metabolite transporter